MADKKISALTSATTPLAGTEVLPIVQSGSTVKVAVSNLTAGRAVSTGVLTSSASSNRSAITSTSNGAYATITTSGKTSTGTNVGFEAGVNILADNTYEVYDTVNSALTVRYLNGNSGYWWFFGNGNARFKIENDTGNVTANVGNFVVGTAGKGIDFSANPHAAGMTSELLNDYEEGEFTPFFTCDGSNPTVTYSAQSGRYTKIGRQVFVQIRLIIDTVSGGSGNLRISGLPYASGASSYANALSRAFVFNFTANLEVFNVPPGSDTVLVYISDFTNTQATSTNLQNGAFCLISGSYTV